MKTRCLHYSKKYSLLSILLLVILLGVSNIGIGQIKTAKDNLGTSQKVLRVQVATAQREKVAENNQLSEITDLNEEFLEDSKLSESPLYSPLANRTASVSGPWNATATWGGQSVPVAGDNVTINAGITVTVTAPAACTSITFAAVNSSSAITINGTNSLAVSTFVSMPRPSSGNQCTINVNAGTMTIGTTLTMSATNNNNNRNDIINITTGSLTVAGTTAAGTTGCIINFTGAGSFTYGGALAGSPATTLFSGCNLNIGWAGTLTAAQSTAITVVTGSNFNYTSASAQTIYARTYGCNLGLSGAGTKTIASTASVTVNGNFNNSSTFSVTDGTTTTDTWFSVADNFTNSGTFTQTGSYSRFILNGASAQVFTNTGTITAGLAEFGVANSAGITISSNSNQIIIVRANLFNGTVTNSNKITLGTGGTSYAVVQRGVAANTSPAGNFDVAPGFNVGTGGYILLYDNGSVAYNTGYEVPSSLTCDLFYIFDAADVTLNTDLTITEELNFYGGTGTPTFRIGAHTLTLGGTITYTVAGTFYGSTSSNLTMNGATTVNAITNGLNNFTINANTTLGGATTVNGILSLISGLLINGSNLTMATGTTISRSGGSLVSAPTFAGTVNLTYTGGSALNTGKELPTGSSVLNNLTTNIGGVTQYAFTTGTTNLLTDAFPNLTSWTGNKGSAAGQFQTVASVNAGGTTPEAEFIGSATHGGSSITYYIYRGPINTAGYSSVNISFKTMSTGNYTQNFPTYLKLQSSTTTSGPWHDVWSVAYSALAAQTVSISNYTTDVGGNMYLQFAYVGDYYATDYWYFDNLVVDGVTITPVASTATINGNLGLTAGTYTIGSGNSLVLNGGISGSSAIIGSTTSNLTVGGTGANLVLPTINNGLNNFTITRPNGVSIASAKSLTVNGTLSNTVGNNGLVIKSDASGTGSLISSTAGVDAKVERYLTKMKWHFIGMPTESGTAGSFHLPSGHSDIYLRTHIESINDFGPFIVPVSVPLIQGRGYECWVGNSVFNQDETIVFPGKLNAGNYTTGSGNFYPLEYTTGHGLNLICNPYPSALQANIGSWSKSNIANKVWTWSPAFGNYVFWGSGDDYGIGSFGTMTGGVIPEMQAFFVEATGSGPSLTIPQSSRIHSSQAYYKDSEIPVNTIRFDVTGNGYQDAIFINFNELSTELYDSEYDIEKLFGLDEAPQLYSEITGKKLSINALPSFDENSSIPIGFECSVSSTFTLSASGMEGFEQGVEFYLEDLKEEIVQNLNENQVYTFTSSPLGDASRFLLHFANPSSVADNTINPVRIYADNNEIHILNLDQGKASVFVYDLMGRLVAEKQISGENSSRINIETGSGYYLVTVQTEDQVITQKVFLR